MGVVDVNITGSGSRVAGLVGWNCGSITTSYSTGSISGDQSVGGLVGENLPFHGSIIASYSTSSVRGNRVIGGLVGLNGGSIKYSYSSGTASGTVNVGGLVGDEGVLWLSWLIWGNVSASFWDIQSSGQSGSASGTGLETVEMQTAATFLDAGWDFVDETANGTVDIWWIDEGRDYPHLWWELLHRPSREP